MHSSSFDTDLSGKDGGEVLVAIATLVTEGRIPGKLNNNSKTNGFYEGPHCIPNKTAAVKEHKCSPTDALCRKFESTRNQILNLWRNNIPLCVEVLLTCSCKDDLTSIEVCEKGFVLEKWFFNITPKRITDKPTFNFAQLVNAVRSQLYFSQLTAWLIVQETDEEEAKLKITKDNLCYHLCIPGETFASTQFSVSDAIKHEFPLTDLGNNFVLNVSFLTLPRMPSMPDVRCKNCSTPVVNESNMFDDRMYIHCKLKGKHCCEDFYYDLENKCDSVMRNYLTTCQNRNNHSCSDNSKQEASTSKLNDGKVWRRNFLNSHRNDLNNHVQDKGKLLLDAIERSGQKNDGSDKNCDDYVEEKTKKCEGTSGICDMRAASDNIFSIKTNNKFNVCVNKYCDSPIPNMRHVKQQQNNNQLTGHKNLFVKKITFDDDDINCDNIKELEIPTAFEQAKFRKDLDNAANMVFHSQTGLPLTSSPAPVRRDKSCFDFDSSITSVSDIKSALFATSPQTDDDSEGDVNTLSPCSPETTVTQQKRNDKSHVKYNRKGRASNLLGSFEESVLNGRLEPVSTVHGFSAELGANGSFVPNHLVVPVTVFFYTLTDNEKLSSPYLGHINLGKKGYNVPKTGNLQITLFNPLGTVVKMFVIMYDLSEMPPNSHTFMRQRTLYLPINCKDQNVEWEPKWLRYLIHLRFLSSKSGKIYLHSDIRMIVFRRSDVDTANAHGVDLSYEYRSFTHMPSYPRFSPRK